MAKKVVLWSEGNLNIHTRYCKSITFTEVYGLACWHHAKLCVCIAQYYTITIASEQQREIIQTHELPLLAGMTGQLSNLFIRDLEAIHQLIVTIKKQGVKS